MLDRVASITAQGNEPPRPGLAKPITVKQQWNTTEDLAAKNRETTSAKAEAQIVEVHEGRRKDDSADRKRWGVVREGF